MPANKYSAEDIANHLCEFLREHVLASSIIVSADTELTDIGVDSFSLMELVLFIERKYGLELPAESLTPENISSVATLSAYCVTQLNTLPG